MRFSKFQFSLPSIVGLAIAAGLTAAPQDVRAAEVITLTQTACQFVESEGKDHGYKSNKKADCEAINAKTGEQRLNDSSVLRLKAGDYVFRVSNKNVPYDLGFWVRDKDYNWANPIHKATKTSVSGGGLSLGVTKDYKVSLAPGEYLYSCPLNSTPDYKIIVEG